MAKDLGPDLMTMLCDKLLRKFLGLERAPYTSIEQHSK